MPKLLQTRQINNQNRKYKQKGNVEYLKVMEKFFTSWKKSERYEVKQWDVTSKQSNWQKFQKSDSFNNGKYAAMRMLVCCREEGKLAQLIWRIILVKQKKCRPMALQISLLSVYSLQKATHIRTGQHRENACPALSEIVTESLVDQTLVRLLGLFLGASVSDIVKSSFGKNSAKL